MGAEFRLGRAKGQSAKRRVTGTTNECGKEGEPNRMDTDQQKMHDHETHEPNENVDGKAAVPVWNPIVDHSVSREADANRSWSGHTPKRKG